MAHGRKTGGKDFKKGQSGNPGGRPKYKEISHAIRHILTLSEKEFAEYEPGTIAERLAYIRIKQAVLKGGLFEAQFIADRAEGKAVATVKATYNLDDTRLVVDILNPPDESAPKENS